MTLNLKNYSFAILFIIVSFFSGLFAIMVLSSETPYQEIIVQEGDSLWSLAEKYENMHMMSTEEFIGWVQKENRLLNAYIKPGDKLLIPIEQSVKEPYSQVALNEE
ncbi:MAG TPA: LysM peptidoglycan-binding domain-containing protein [Chondromyces sp.]|nr:LysM peptidoglycan-binding domain-containing protein [Chondromyces sp.]